MLPRHEVPTIHVDAVPNVDQVYSAGFEIVGPIGRILGDLASGDRASSWSLAEIAAHRRELMRLCSDGRTAGRLNPSDVVGIIREAMPRETVVSTDVGSHKLLVGQGWTTYRPRAMLMTNGLSSMGYALPAAIASKIVQPERPCVCFVGDGGLAMVQGELRLASSLKLDPIIIVFCDNSLNRIELKQGARQYPSFGTTIDATDVAMLAHSMGCAGINVDSAAGLERALSEPRPSDRPLVVGATIDPSQYLAQF